MSPVGKTDSFRFSDPGSDPFGSDDFAPEAITLFAPSTSIRILHAITLVISAEGATKPYRIPRRMAPRGSAVAAAINAAANVLTGTAQAPALWSEMLRSALQPAPMTRGAWPAECVIAGVSVAPRISN